MTLILYLDHCFYSIQPRIYMISNPTLWIAEFWIPGIQGVSYE